MDRKDLKIHALKERISILTMNYEDQDADRRVEITVVTDENSQLKAEVKRLSEQLSEFNDRDVEDGNADEPQEDDS